MNTQSKERRSTVAIVPMRHQSERVQGKNYRELEGIPLFHYVIEALLAVPSIDRVVIDTDSPQILEDAAIAFPSVYLVERPETLRDGTIPMNKVLVNTLGSLEYDTVLQTHSTNPFVTAPTFESALESYHNALACDSLFSVSPLHARLWDSEVRPVNHDPDVLLRTQDIPPLFVENSCFFIFDRNEFLRTHRRIGVHPRMHEISALQAIDIDTESDWELASVIARGRSTTRSSSGTDAH